MDELTRGVHEYQRTGNGLAQLVEQISTFVYEFPSGKGGFSEEDGAELLLRFLPRVQGLVRRYRDTGRSFESYLAATLRWQLRTLAAERASENIRKTALTGPGTHISTESADWAETESAQVCEPTAPISSGQCDRLLRKGQARRLLYFSLKMTETLGEDEYARVARAVGCDPEWLIDCWQRLRLQCHGRRERKQEEQHRRDRAWFRVRCIQYRLKLTLDPTERDAAVRKLDLWQRRYHAASRKLERMHPFPTHAEIAGVLNVPKGSIDSSIFYGKRELRDPACLAVLASAVANP